MSATLFVPTSCTTARGCNWQLGNLLLCVFCVSAAELQRPEQTFDAANAVRPNEWGWWAPAEVDVGWYNITRTMFSQHAAAAPARRALGAPLIPHRIHQIWLGSPLPDRFKRFTMTWQRHHPSWEYRLWTDRDVAGLHLHNQALFDQATNLGEKSDILRLELLYKFGGLYVDTDFECLKSFAELHATNRWIGSLSNVGVFEVTNGIIASAAGHPFTWQLMEAMQQPAPVHLLAAAEQSEWQGMPIIRRSGPGVFTRGLMSILQHQIRYPSRSLWGVKGAIVLPIRTCFPIPNIGAEATHTSKSRLQLEFGKGPWNESIAVHHWAASWL